MTDNKARATAIRAAITATLPAGVSVYDADKVPGSTEMPAGTLPARYVTIELSRRFNPVRRLSEDVMITPGAVTTHYRGVSVNQADDLREAVKAALENQMYDLPGGDKIGPFSFEIDGGMKYVAEGWSGFDTWTF